MPPPRLVVATHNPGKLRELQSLLATSGWLIEGLDARAAAPEETGATFAENARLKALHGSRTELDPVLADDSGLEVFALGNRPGVHSARYGEPGASDTGRVARLLQELATAGGGREARFVCAIALARRGKILFEAEAECRGTIAAAPRGRGGFGYDPVFLVPELGRTFAELTESEKNAHSHRARAAQALVGYLRLL
jgi:XTP/dITP diphosphohydrolase